MKTSGRAMGAPRADSSCSDPAVSYNEFKEYEEQAEWDPRCGGC
jgi:hypothetical protein